MKIKTYINHSFEVSKKIAFQDPKQSYEIAEEAFELATSYNMELEKGLALYQMAYACRVMSKYSEGIRHGFQALEIFITLDNTLGIYKVRNIIGILYFYFGSYTDALEHFMEAYELIKGSDDKNLESAVLNNIGEVYREAGDYDKSKKYYDKALVISKASGLEYNSAAIYLNIGEILFKTEKYKASLNHLKKGYDILIKNGYMLEQAEAETKLGRAMAQEEKFEEAKKLFLKALNKYREINLENNKFYLVDLLIEMAKLDVIQSFNPMRNFNEALEIALNTGMEKKVAIIYKAISEYYEKKEDYKLALDYFRSYHLKLAEVEASNLSIRLEILSVEFNYYRESTESIKFKKMSEKLRHEIDNTNLALERMKNANKSLLKVSLNDELTKLFNRRGIEKAFKELFSQTTETMGVILLMDIDRFKNYNDTWGHIQGDVCLVSIADVLKKQSFRDYFVGRFGGEEFIAFFKVDSIDEAYEACEFMRKEIIHLGIKADKTEESIVTMSFGAYFGKIKKGEVKERIALADRQLYLAKEDGRNNVKITE